jgi:hypothetical protein
MEIESNNLPAQTLPDFNLDLDSIRSAIGEYVIEPGQLFTPELAEQIGALVYRVNQIFQPFAEAIAPLVQAAAPLIELGADYAGKFEQTLKRHQEIQTEIAKELRKDGLFLSPYFFGLSLPELYDLFYVEGISSIQIIDKYFSVEQNIEALLKSWETSETHASRLHILGPAMYTHFRKEYVLSVPTFLAQIDGILAEFLGTKKDHRYGPLLEKKQEKRPEGEWLDKLYWELRGSDLLVDAIADQLFQHSEKYDKLDKKLYPNRHAILHGGDLDYHRIPHGSLRCILVLDWLTRPREEKHELV